MCTHPSAVETQFTFCNLYVTGAENWKLGHDWRLVRTHRRHDTTRLRCRQIVQRLVETRQDCRQQLRIQYTPPTQLNSTVELRRRRRCVLGFTYLFPSLLSYLIYWRQSLVYVADLLVMILKCKNGVWPDTLLADSFTVNRTCQHHTCRIQQITRTSLFLSSQLLLLLLVVVVILIINPLTPTGTTWWV